MFNPKRRMIAFGIALLIIWTNAGTAAVAFEQDGLKIGMSLSEVQDVLKSRRIELLYSNSHNNVKYYTSNNDERLQFNFCDGRLFSYYRPVDSLSKMLSSLNAQTIVAGPATYETKNNMLIFRWKSKDEYHGFIVARLTTSLPAAWDSSGSPYDSNGNHVVDVFQEYWVGDKMCNSN